VRACGTRLADRAVPIGPTRRGRVGGSGCDRAEDEQAQKRKAKKKKITRNERTEMCLAGAKDLLFFLCIK